MPSQDADDDLCVPGFVVLEPGKQATGATGAVSHSWAASAAKQLGDGCLRVSRGARPVASAESLAVPPMRMGLSESATLNQFVSSGTQHQGDIVAQRRLSQIATGGEAQAIFRRR